MPAAWCGMQLPDFTRFSVLSDGIPAQRGRYAGCRSVGASPTFPHFVVVANHRFGRGPAACPAVVKQDRARFAARPFYSCIGNVPVVVNEGPAACGPPEERQKPLCRFDCMAPTHWATRCWFPCDAFSLPGTLHHPQSLAVAGATLVGTVDADAMATKQAMPAASKQIRGSHEPPEPTPGKGHRC